MQVLAERCFWTDYDNEQKYIEWDILKVINVADYFFVALSILGWLCFVEQVRYVNDLVCLTILLIVNLFKE